MEEVLKLVKEEQSSIEALMQENGGSNTKELKLLHNKSAKLHEISAAIKAYHNIK